tara:strand:- start:115 stop:381 length:267 start_codon:yes stop_codon:yes gene_type:complete
MGEKTEKLTLPPIIDIETYHKIKNRIVRIKERNEKEELPLRLAYEREVADYKEFLTRDRQRKIELRKKGIISPRERQQKEMEALERGE